ncbi:hypothetical protein AKG11_28185 [Shinella sp. SUS2]|uniref:DUF935 domain-containing protein n=1 Tax=unclassified Shinella TaxID=2643062 RepID=UPI00067FA456|nr:MULTISPECIES: DUF935 domain-containing protein [unclassified Shinella]KNY13616.1 hypothetical protein AKG11_28185 [Shinella sp. SUS2]KOC72509.1 hypothetical protein AKG10_27050 [Shinella sp. GWS1]
MASLRDWMNHLVNSTSLKEMVAGPKIGGVRQVISGHPAEGLTPQRLASILRAAAQGEPEAYFELAEDIEERDLHYAAVMATRKRSVAQLPITVKAASDSPEHKKHAELIQAWLDTGVLRAALFDMLDAIGKGISIMEIDWQAQGGRLLPRKLIWRTQRWFTFDPDDGETVLLREGVTGVPLPAHKFAVHRHKTKSGLTIRSGVARVALWAWMFKSFTTKDWAIFVQNYGQPIRIGKYGRGATEAEKDVLWRAVTGIAGDCAAIVPREMLIEFHEVGSKSSSTDMFERRADWLDRQISKLVLGQTTTTDAVSGGHAVSQEHRLVQEDIERADAADVAGTANEQIIPNIVAFNFGPQDAYPTTHIGRPDEVPLEQFANAFAKLAPQGLTASASYMRDRMGIPAPKDGDDLIGGKAHSTPDTLEDPDMPPAAGKGMRAQLRKDTKERTLHVSRLIGSLHARGEGDEIVDRMVARLEEDAAGAMGGLIDDVRKELMAASDLRDAADRLARLQLSPDDLAEAMSRAMALAHLAGQAALIDDMAGRS